MNSIFLPMESLDLSTMNREDFADQFENLKDFLFYVKSEPSYEEDDYIYSMYMGENDVVIIVEQPKEELFDMSLHFYEIDDSWRYIAMDWFDYIGTNVW